MYWLAVDARPEPAAARPVAAPAAAALDDVLDQCQRMGEVLLVGLDTGHGMARTREDFRGGVAELLDALAESVCASRDLPDGSDELRDALREQLVLVRARHEHLTPDPREHELHAESRSVRGGLVLAALAPQQTVH